MRTWLIASVVGASIVGVGHGQAQPANRNTVYIAPNIARSLTISRSGVVLTTLAVPQGTILSVTFDTDGSALPSNDGRFSFHGNVEIRAMASSQKPNLELANAMLRSPLQLAGTGVDVSITPQ